jgi:predicted metal-dependent hydrolase
MAIIEEAVKKRSDWIFLKRQQSLERLDRFPVHTYVEGETFLFLGKNLTLHYSMNVKKPFAAGSVLFVPAAKREKAGQAGQAVEAWYKEQARLHFAARLEYFSAAMGVRYASLRLSSATARWGSCGVNGSINLAWRLIAAPNWAVDYVVVHELAHILRRDHSAAFWAEVGKVLPDYKKRRKALNEYAPLLIDR